MLSACFLSVVSLYSVFTLISFFFGTGLLSLFNSCISEYSIEKERGGMGGGHYKAAQRMQTFHTKGRCTVILFSENKHRSQRTREISIVLVFRSCA